MPSQDGELRILLVDDEESVRDTVSVRLSDEGYSVTVARNAAEAVETLAHFRPHVAILDVRLGVGKDGLALARELRSLLQPPPAVLFLSAVGDLDGRLAGFAVGGEDYVIKPFAMAELAARVAVLARRVETPSVISVGEVAVDEAAREARRGEDVLELTPTQFDLLHVLAQSAGTVVSHRQLRGKVWSGQRITSSTIHSHIAAIRRELDPPGKRPLLRTISGVGYMLTSGRHSSHS